MSYGNVIITAYIFPLTPAKLDYYCEMCKNIYFKMQENFTTTPQCSIDALDPAPANDHFWGL